MLADEKLVSERLAQERDNAEKNARQNETKVRIMVHQIEEKIGGLSLGLVTKRWPTINSLTFWTSSGRYLEGGCLKDVYLKGSRPLHFPVLMNIFIVF